jgi:hypothetical protein
MNQRPGYFSPLGILVAALLVAAVVALTLTLGPVLFSPGALNAQAKTAPLNGVASHAALGNHCTACHTAPWSSATMADKCLGCHTNVRTEMSSRQGLHGTLLGASASPTCGGCHPDHQGANGSLTSLNEATFPHDLLGYSLRTHRGQTCADCHPKGLTTFDVATCAACHGKMDASFMSKHLASFGSDCTPCHDGTGSTTVDHSKFAFKLTGKHAGLSCNACHANAKSLADYQATPQDCYSCHAKSDKHNGSFGKDCGSCHNTNGWTGATFSHTIFPVTHGQDQEPSTCQTCHPVNTSQYTCFGCHRHTQANVVSGHEGQSLAQLSDCIKCHAGGRVPD